MEKEILTLEIIRKDVKKYFKSIFVGFVLILPLYALICYIAVFLVSLVLNLVVQNKMTLNVIVVVLLSICGLVCVYEFIKTMGGFIQFLKGEIQITDDWLVDKLPRRYGRYSRRPDTFVFARCGEFGLTDSYYYKWSDLHSMNEGSLFRSSNLDEDFYVVSIGKVKNIMVYNKKMFELRQ